MSDDSGALSIDFIVGFTIFLIAFIWVISLIPGLLINLQGHTIDYDAVAYRTGVILAEDPGAPADPGWPFIRPREVPWEFRTDKRDVSRLGLATSRDMPNILSENKVNHFFDRAVLNTTVDFRSKTIFGDYPYRFNISLLDEGQTRSVGYGLPTDTSYGYIQRFVKIKGGSNATINESYIRDPSHYYINTDNVTTHKFSILINNTELHEGVTNPLYVIDPEKEQIIINITDLNSTRSNLIGGIRLSKIDVLGNVPILSYPGIVIATNNEIRSFLPADDVENISLKFSPQFFTTIYNQRGDIPLYINLTFDLATPGTFLNSSKTGPYKYNYDTGNNVRQPQLRDGVLEVAIWGGETTSMVSWIITSLPGAGGKISPSGSVNVAEGASQTFSIMPDAGYAIVDVLVDGISNGAISSYTFTNVVADGHTISASFINVNVGIQYINASAGANGSISPSGNVSVARGLSRTFTITPIAGYAIKDVFVDGTSIGTPSSYTFFNVQVNHTINASFKVAPPVASFTTNTTTGTVPLPVQFTDTSTGIGPFTYTWDFGDIGAGNTSTLQNPSHTYTTIGIYTAQLTVTNVGGTSTATRIITVNQVGAPVAEFSVNTTSGLAPLAVQFTDASTGSIISYLWDFGDTATSTDQSPSHQYSAAGNYTVNLTVTGPGGSDSEVKIKYITVSVSHIITATAGAGGTIAPSGAVGVADGASQIFTISRNPGYHIVDVLVNGGSIGAVSTYTFTNVVTDGQTIDASFAQNPRGQIYYEGFESGSTGWVLTGASRQNGAVPKNQTWSMRLQDTDSMYLTIPTTGFSSIEVHFAWALTSNAGENAYAEYSTNGGSTWTILSQINGPVTQTTLSVAPISSLPTTAQLRFRIAGSNTQDKLYVDDVILTGIPD